MKNIFLLDADETVLDFKRGEREQLRNALSFFGIASDEALLSRFHQINDGLWKRLERGETTRDRLVVDRFSLLFGEYGIGADPTAVSEKYVSCMGNAAYWIDGAEAFMKELKRRGRVYMVTNGSRAIQRSRFALTGIDRIADGVFISEEVGSDKPSERFALYVEAHIPDYDRARAVWIGDSLTSDCACAARAGIDFILYAKSRPDGYEGAFAADYAKILQILQKEC